MMCGLAQLPRRRVARVGSTRPAPAAMPLPMRQHIAFLHTSPVHVETFGRLVEAADPAVLVEHVVAEDLLHDAQRLGADDPGLVGRIHKAMADAAAHGAAMVVCTCSTIGGAAERTPTGAGFTVARIDRAMADRAVELGPRILIVAALASTLMPTARLIQESAVARHAEVVLDHLLVDGAWLYFQSGDRIAFLATVAAAVRAHPGPADAVVLAQASMAPAADLLRDLGVEVLSSPARGVRRILDCLQIGR